MTDTAEQSPAAAAGAPETPKARPRIAVGPWMLTMTGLGWLIAAAIFVADQVSKTWLLYVTGFYADQSKVIEVTPFFNLVMVWNRGVSFGLFQAGSIAGVVFLIVFSLAVTAGLAWWLRSIDSRRLALGIGMIIGGALGNVIDRVLYGAVADFFHLHAFGFNWYVFNIADCAIVCGVAVLVYDSLMSSGDTKPAA